MHSIKNWLRTSLQPAGIQCRRRQSARRLGRRWFGWRAWGQNAGSIAV